MPPPLPLTDVVNNKQLPLRKKKFFNQAEYLTLILAFSDFAEISDPRLSPLTTPHLIVKFLPSITFQ